MIFPADEDSIARAADIIVHGGLVALPTETVYGLGADALNPSACAKIFAAKNRPHFDPLIVHIADLDMFQSLTTAVSEQILRLTDEFWPGPLTVVVRKSDAVPDIITSGLPTVAIRMPRHDVAISLIKKSGKPIAAPSANPFGYLSPTEAKHVEEQLGSKVDMILDGGSCTVGVESTIVKFHNGRIHLLRPGGIPVEEIQRVIGSIAHSSPDEIPDAPGQMPWHYAPRAKVVLIREGEEIPEQNNTALCAFRSNVRRNQFIHEEILSPNGDFAEAAVNLFSALHRLDASGAKIIYAEEVPEKGLGLAIMNRLRKAAAR
jgi:L-threonylcarbamoyladenylate synthase